MLQDLRLALRRLAATPTFTTAVVLTLALGIGANAAMGGIIAAVLIRPLPLPDAGAVVSVRAVNPTIATVSVMSARDVEEWAAASRTIAAFGAWRDWSFSRSTPTGRERYYGIISNAAMIEVLGVQPVLGRFFTEQENQPGQGASVIVLTESTWRGRLGADPSVLGRTIVLSRAPTGERPFTIIGVIPDVDLPSLADVTFFAPSAVDEDAASGRWHRNRQVWARLSRGSSLQDAASELTTFAAQLAVAYPDSHKGWTVNVQPLARTEIGDTRTTLLLFAAAVIAVLLIACANVAGLLIARASSREREFAVRAALGGGPGHILRLVLAEAVVLGTVAGVASLLVRLWLLDILSSLGPAIPRMAPVSPLLAVALTLGVSFVAVAAFGALPALQAARAGLAHNARYGNRSVTIGGGRTRSWLVGAQVAAAVMLLTGAAVSLREVARLLAPPPGFDPTGVVLTQLFPSPTRYATRDALAQLVPRTLEDARTIPGVQAVSTASAGPLFGGDESVEVDPGGSTPADGKYPDVRFFDVSPGYFQTIGTRLVEGRDFTARDSAGAPLVAIVNASLASRFWPQGSAVGRRIRLVREGRQLEIVGVVADFPKSVDAGRVVPEIYWPYLQQPRWAFYLVVRSSGSPENTAAAVRARLAALDPDLVPPRITSLAAIRARATRAQRFGAAVLGLFALSALLLAALGTYALVSYAAGQRTREIGIRISFGATSRDIMKLIMRTGVLPILYGTGAGLVAASAATRTLRSAIGGIGVPDVWTFAASAAVLLACATLACLVPARRATHVDAVTVLASE